MRACLYLWLDAHHIFNGGTSDSKLSPYLYCPRQYHVCALLQWCTLHGISVLLYVESSFCSAIINYQSSHPVFLFLIIPKNTCARAIFQSEQQKKRSPVTKNPPSRNRKPRFASPLITIHRPPFSAPALMFLEATRTIVRGRSRAAALCPSVLLSFCSSVSRVSGFRAPATASALMYLEATRTVVRGRPPRSGLMCILCKLM